MSIPCELFETRRVLSAVSGLAVFDQLPSQTETVDEQTTGDPGTAPVDGMFPLGNPEGAPPLFMEQGPVVDGAQNDPARNVDLRPETLDAVFGGFNETLPDRDPDEWRPRPPRISDSTVDSSGADLFDNVASSSEQIMLAGAQAESLTDTGAVANSDSATAKTGQTDGFIEIPRITNTRPDLNGLLPGDFNQEKNSQKDNLGRQFDLREEPQSDTDTEDSALQAAMEFFNRQTAGGFVDADLGDLHAAAFLATSTKSSGGAASLEAGLGRFNPFDDHSHTTMLTAVELHHVAETDSIRDADAGADVALTSIILGAVGVQSGSFGRLGQSFRRFATWLRSTLGIE